VPRVERGAHVSWEGNLARGAGLISSTSGAFAELPYSLATRVGQPEGKTSPEELLAAAHAACLAMSLAGELTSAGTPPERLDVDATIRLDERPGRGHLVVGSKVQIRGRVTGLSDAAWEHAVEEADRGCTFSALLRDAGAEVHLDARLEER
jgi:osmotically inducible protein OsmC